MRKLLEGSYWCQDSLTYDKDTCVGLYQKPWSDAALHITIAIQTGI